MANQKIANCLVVVYKKKRVNVVYLVLFYTRIAEWEEERKFEFLGVKISFICIV